MPTCVSKHIPSTDSIFFHTKQMETIRNQYIPIAKVIQESKEVARLPLPEIPEESLPDITICTLTRNHRLLFPLVVNSVHHQSYPLHKIEWIVLQNGDEEVDDLIS